MISFLFSFTYHKRAVYTFFLYLHPHPYRKVRLVSLVEVLMMAVMGMNLFGHIVESYIGQWGFDPASMPTYPPTITPKSLPGIFGGSGMVKSFIFSSHACHCLHALNFQVLATHNHNITLHALNSFAFLAVLISILLQLLMMNSLHFVVLPHGC